MFWLRIQLIWGDLLWGLPQTGGPSCGGFTREIMNETIMWRTGFSKFDLSIQPISTCLFLWGMSGCRKLTNVANAAAISGLHIGNKGIEMPYVVDASRCLMSGWTVADWKTSSATPGWTIYKSHRNIIYPAILKVTVAIHEFYNVQHHYGICKISINYPCWLILRKPTYFSFILPLGPSPSAVMLSVRTIVTWWKPGGSQIDVESSLHPLLSMTNKF